MSTEEEVKATMSKEVVTDQPLAVPVAEEEEEEETSSVTKNVVDDDQEVSQPIPSVVTDEKADNVNVSSVTFPDNEVKALVELKKLIQTALNNHEFSAVVGITLPPSPPPLVAVEDGGEKEEEKSQETVNVVTEKELEVKKVSVDEDGAKTVEAIEETVVSVTVSSTEVHQQQQQMSPDKGVEEPVVAADESSPPAAEKEKQEAKEEAVSSLDEDTASSSLPEEVSIWGVPLMKDERTDTILWKFLRARDFKVKEAFTMIKNTIKWRKEIEIDNLLEENLGGDLADKVAFMHGVSKEGNPVCYNVYGAFQDKELYLKTFSDEVKRQKFLKWRIQFLEKSIRKLDFSPNGINTIVQVNDLKNSPGPGKWELRQATKQALQLFQDNYPEFVAKQVFINVPWWYVAANKMISPFLTQRTKSKFVMAGPSKSAETLFNYIAPEQVPIQYGGLSKTGAFGVKDGVTQIIVKPTCRETVEFAVTEACHLTWEVRVLGWEVSYGAEFVPNAKENYTVIIQKLRKVGPTEETIITNTFKSGEPGKVVLTIDNSSTKKKRLLYRLKPVTI